MISSVWDIIPLLILFLIFPIFAEIISFIIKVLKYPEEGI